MLVVSGIVEIAEADLPVATAAAARMAVETRNEAGCHAYAFYQDVENPCRVRVFEEWEDEASLAAHMKTPHMAAFREVLGGITIVSREIKKYEVGAVDTL